MTFYGDAFDLTGDLPQSSYTLTDPHWEAAGDYTSAIMVPDQEANFDLYLAAAGTIDALNILVQGPNGPQDYRMEHVFLRDVNGAVLKSGLPLATTLGGLWEFDRPIPNRNMSAPLRVTIHGSHAGPPSRPQVISGPFTFWVLILQRVVGE